METLERQKAEIRKTMKSLQGRVTAEEKTLWDQMLYERLCSLPEIEQAEWIYGYMSLKTEAGTHEFLKRILEAGKKLALPRVEGPKMRFYPVRSFRELSKGAYGIYEPLGSCIPAKEKNAVMLVPGTAFTREGQRLGKGGGFYDRFLFGEPEHQTIGLAYEFQILKTVPAGAFDRKIDMVVTPSAVYRSRISKTENGIDYS